MNRRSAWMGGAVGAFAVWRWLRRKPAPSVPAVEPDPRAEELRARLAESKSVVEERETFEAGETPVDEADPDARRRSVHDAARAKLDELSDD